MRLPPRTSCTPFPTGIKVRPPPITQGVASAQPTKPIAHQQTLNFQTRRKNQNKQKWDKFQLLKSQTNDEKNQTNEEDDKEPEEDVRRKI